VVTLASLAWMFSPAEDGHRFVILEAGERWALDRRAASEADVAIWGQAPLRSGAARTAALRWCLARERATARVRARPPVPLSITGVHRIPPPLIRPGGIRNRIREAVLGGVLVELWKGQPGRRLIDAAAEAAGATAGAEGFRPGSGGTGLARIVSGHGVPLVLRVAPTGSSGDPLRAADALERLAGSGSSAVPRLAGRGTVGGVSWTAETLLRGRRPVRVTSSLAAEAAAFCTVMPTSDEPATAHREDLDAIARVFPSWRAILVHARAASDAAGSSTPSIMRHGDFWAGNLLADGGTLTGVIDWDAWHRAGLPGTDLLHLVAMEEGRGAPGGLGGVWLGRPWRSAAFSDAGAGYWARLGVRPDEALLEGVGIAWWACQVAATLSRLPELAEDERWVDQNVQSVLAALAR
jgi:hypothetical protein